MLNIGEGVWLTRLPQSATDQASKQETAVLVKGLETCFLTTLTGLQTRSQQ